MVLKEFLGRNWKHFQECYNVSILLYIMFLYHYFKLFLEINKINKSLLIKALKKILKKESFKESFKERKL